MGSQRVGHNLVTEQQRRESDFPGGSVDKETACGAGDPGSIPGLGRSPGEGNGKTLKYPCLANPKDREAWWTQRGSQRVGHD